MYDGFRYEVEEKYTQTVAYWSRPVTARLDMGPLAAALNKLEAGLPEVGGGGGRANGRPRKRRLLWGRPCSFAPKLAGAIDPAHAVGSKAAASNSMAAGA
jgi:hypothetical protein